MKAGIDHFKGNLAVLLIGDEEIKVVIPRKLLPKGVKEGSWLKVSFELDPEGKKRQRLSCCRRS